MKRATLGTRSSLPPTTGCLHRSMLPNKSPLEEESPVVRVTTHSDLPPRPRYLIPGVTGATPTVPQETRPEVEIKLRPTEQQVRDAADVADEIKRSKTYEGDFSKKSPDAREMASALLEAKGYSDELQRARAWVEILEYKEGVSWQKALEITRIFQEFFDPADKHDPTVAERYPQCKAFLGVRTAVAMRAAETRRRNKARKVP